MGKKTEIIKTNSERETIEFAKRFARDMSDHDIILLYGTLGMGKSVVSRAIIRELCDDENMEVPSPTFTLVQTYESQAFPIWHFDLYRLGDVSEIYEIGWEDATAGGVLLVEWPERLGELIPENRIEIHIAAQDNAVDARLIEVKYVRED